jgi:hypothetical protein
MPIFEFPNGAKNSNRIGKLSAGRRAEIELAGDEPLLVGWCGIGGLDPAARKKDVWSADIFSGVHPKGQVAAEQRDETRLRLDETGTSGTDSRTIIFSSYGKKRMQQDTVDARLSARHVHRRPMTQHSGPKARAVYVGKKNTTARMDRVEAQKQKQLGALA